MQLAGGPAASTIKITAAAINWAHQIAGHTANPCLTPLVKHAIESAIRQSSRPVVKKSEFSFENYCRLIEYSILASKPSLSNWQTAAMVALGYWGFLRCNEVASIRVLDLTFTDSHLAVKISKSKTDQLRHGAEILIRRSPESGRFCPVRIISRYLSELLVVPTIKADSQIFTKLVYHKNLDSQLPNFDMPQTPKRLNEIFKKAADGIGLDTKRFTFHSLRAGGATLAAAAGVPDRIFKAHGRWKSETAKDGYVHAGIEERESVTKKMSEYGRKTSRRKFMEEPPH